MFPALVGMNLPAKLLQGAAGNVPRTRGDEPLLGCQLITEETCSPHSWG